MPKNSSTGHHVTDQHFWKRNTVVLIHNSSKLKTEYQIQLKEIKMVNAVY